MMMAMTTTTTTTTATGHHYSLIVILLSRLSFYFVQYLFVVAVPLGYFLKLLRVKMPAHLGTSSFANIYLPIHERNKMRNIGNDRSTTTKLYRFFLTYALATMSIKATTEIAICGNKMFVLHIASESLFRTNRYFISTVLCRGFLFRLRF
jgi:hypothetical protein